MMSPLAPGTDPADTRSVDAVSLVTASGLAKRYGSVVVLEDVSFTVGPGITGLLGANGSGKTTILGLILGLHRSNGGTLEVLGHDPWSAGAEVRTRVGYAPEHHTLPPDLRAADFVRHVTELHGIPPEEAKTRASDALWLVELGEERFRPMGTMSTGQRQRVKLAQAISHDPEFVLLDEPTDGLDPTQREVMLNLIRSLSRDFGMNVVLSSHLIDEVERVCDQVIIIGDGRTMVEGTVNDLRGSAAAGIVAEIDGSESEIESLVADLRRSGLQVRVNGRQLILNTGLKPTPGEDRDDQSPATTPPNTSSNEVLDRLRDGCVDHEVGLIRLDQRRLRLEEVFLEHLG
ncbi:MAG: ABC transporter ATP-binding protein [Acidimicrobiia bacterium]|nr:ABC transporter ATP-binding protein [Acidimicrobiia bacterium]